jgi:hypothetical protein
MMPSTPITSSAVKATVVCGIIKPSMTIGPSVMR